MGCYDGTEIFELVEIIILNKLSNIIDKESNDNDSFGVFHKFSGPK